MLGAFHQQPARVGIAALGDAPLAPFVTRSIFRRDQAQIGHHLARMSKAMHFSQLAHQDHGRHGLKTLHGHEGTHRRLEPPLLQQSAHPHLAPLDPFSCRRDPLEILFQNHLHGRMRQDQFAQVTLVGRAPGAFSLVTIPVAEQEPF
jgi:hypothetical protein